MDEKETEGTQLAAPTSVDEVRDTAHQYLQQYQYSTSTEHSARILANTSVATSMATLTDTSAYAETPTSASFPKERDIKPLKVKEAKSATTMEEETEWAANTSDIMTEVEDASTMAASSDGEVRDTTHPDKRQFQLSMESLAETLANPSADTSTRSKGLFFKISLLSQGILRTTSDVTSLGVFSTWLISFSARTSVRMSAAIKQKMSKVFFKLILAVLKQQVAAITSAVTSENTMATFRRTTTIELDSMLSWPTSTTSAETLAQALPAVWRIRFVTIFPEPIAKGTAKMAARMISAMTLPTLRRKLFAAAPATLSVKVNIVSGPAIEIKIKGKTIGREKVRRAQQKAEEYVEENARTSWSESPSSEKYSSCSSSSDMYSSYSCSSDASDLEMEKM